MECSQILEEGFTLLCFQPPKMPLSSERNAYLTYYLTVFYRIGFFSFFFFLIIFGTHVFATHFAFTHACFCGGYVVRTQGVTWRTCKLHTERPFGQPHLFWVWAPTTQSVGHAASAHSFPRRELNPGSSSCEAERYPTEPPSPS